MENQIRRRNRLEGLIYQDKEHTKNKKKIKKMISDEAIASDYCD